ncbi:MAG: glycosyltransferase family 2 protein [Patescibacteria group bacterium]
MKIELSVIIVTWNAGKTIGQCLNSIYGKRHDFSFEVVVVDNGSKDKTIKIIKSGYEEARLFRNKENLGFSLANNIGLAAALGRYVLFLNQDVELLDDALEAMLGCLKRNSGRKIAAVAPKLVYPNGELQLSLRVFPTPGNVLIDAFTFGLRHGKQYDYSKSQVVDQPMASCLMVKKQALDAIGGFDTDRALFLYFNDVDLSFRIKELGYKHYYLAQSKAIHRHGEAAGRWPESGRIKAWCRGLYYFLVKHYAKEHIGMRILLMAEVFLIFMARMTVSVIKGKNK